MNCSVGHRKQAVTVVHGTIPHLGSLRLSPLPTWVEKDSPMCKAIAKTGQDVKIVPFKWNGRNSHRERLKAGDLLAAQLRQTLQNNPDAEHHIVAHSHGGNVALYALRSLEPEQRDRFTSLSCLGTPFFTSFDALDDWRMYVAASVAPVLAFIATVTGFAGIVFRVAAIFVICAFTILLLRRLRSWKVEAPIWKGKICVELPVELRIFCACSKRDEAYHWLNLIASPFAVVRFLFDKALQSFIALVLVPLLVICIAPIGRGIFGLLGHLAQALVFSNLGFHVLWKILVGAGLVITALLLFALMFQLALRATSYGFGESIAESFVVGTEISRDPQEQSKVSVLYYPFSMFTLHHSMLCQPRGHRRCHRVYAGLFGATSFDVSYVHLMRRRAGNHSVNHFQLTRLLVAG